MRRSLSRSPGFTAVAVLTMALGIGANTTMFSIVDGVLLKPLGYRQPDRLISLHVQITTLRNLGVLPLPPFVYDLWREHAKTLESIAVVHPGFETLTGNGAPERVPSARASASFFSTVGVWPAAGRAFAADEDIAGGPRVAIVSDGFWRRQMGAGRDPFCAIYLDGAAWRIIGVMPRGFELPIDLESLHAAHFDILLPADIAPGDRLNHGYWGVARLKPGVTIGQARADLDGVLASLNGLTRRAIIAPLRDNLTARVERGLGLLMAAVGLVLLIACANLANLLLARSLERRKEIAVRCALGASRWRIVRQLFFESLGLAAMGCIAGASCASLAVRAILTQLSADFPHRGAISVDPRTLAFSIALSCLSAVLFAAAPAWRSSSADPAEALAASQRVATDRSSAGARQWLIASQVALCTTLLIGAGLLVRSFGKIMSADRGFETENVITADVPLAGARYADSARRNATYQEIVERLATIPGVSAVGAVTQLPLTGEGFQNPIFLPGVELTPDRIRNLPMAQLRFATSGYFAAAGIALHKGRIYTELIGDQWSAVISESAARRVWPGRNPVGEEFTIDEGQHPRMWRVAGIVADVKQTGLQQPAPLMVYLPATFNGGSDLSFVLRTGLPAKSVARAIRRAVAEVDSAAPVTAIRQMQEIVDSSASQRRFETRLLAAFAAIATLLAALGVYGTLSYSVNRRYREIGIRMALGAQRQDVARMVLRQGLTPVAVGLAIGFAGAVFLMRALRAMLYGVGPVDAAAYSFTGALVLAVAALSCWLPARRATRFDPVETIRCE